MLLKVYETLVCVYHLLEIKRTLYDMCERVTLVIALIQLIQCLNVKIALHDQCGKDSTWETATIWDKVNASVKIGLQLFDALHDLGQVLMLEWLVYAYIVVSPTVMGSR